MADSPGPWLNPPQGRKRAVVLRGLGLCKFLPRRCRQRILRSMLEGLVELAGQLLARCLLWYRTHDLEHSSPWWFEDSTSIYCCLILLPGLYFLLGALPGRRIIALPFLWSRPVIPFIYGYIALGVWWCILETLFDPKNHSSSGAAQSAEDLEQLLHFQSPQLRLARLLYWLKILIAADSIMTLGLLESFGNSKAWRGMYFLTLHMVLRSATSDTTSSIFLFLWSLQCCLSSFAEFLNVWFAYRAPHNVFQWGSNTLLRLVGYSKLNGQEPPFEAAIRQLPLLTLNKTPLPLYLVHNFLHPIPFVLLLVVQYYMRRVRLRAPPVQLAPAPVPPPAKPAPASKAAIRPSIDNEQTVVVPDATDSQDKYCVICWNDIKCVVLLPCRHMCLCPGCSVEYNSRKKPCPLCSKRVQSVMQVYV